MNPLISVIVPVYNVEEYLPRCIDSIINQTYKNLEIILVDDGSPDNCGKICDEYAKKDSRIVVIHKENGGQSTAKNMALDIAKGEYIGFVDSDDYIAPNMYEELYQNLIDNQCDIAMCGRYNVYDDRTEKVFVIDKPMVMENEDIIKRFLTWDNVDSAGCDKLIHKSLLTGIRFPAGYVCEDVIFVYRVLERCKRMIHIGAPMYYYVQRQGSTSRSTFSGKTMGLLMYHKEVFDLAINKYPLLKKEADYCYLSRTIILYRLMHKARYNGGHYKAVTNIIKSNVEKIIFNKYFNKIEKFVALLILTNMYGLAYNIYKKIRK